MDELKKLIALGVALLIGALFAACGSNSPSGSSTPAPDPEIEKVPETDEEWHQAMIEKSLYSYGNTTRMMNKIKQAQNGEEITVAYIGGSITEGISAGPQECYAKLSCDYFAEKFGNGDNVKYVNAGLSGTPSKLGVLRLDRDVLQYDPDVVFIEFAVNDGNEPQYQGAYESMVRRLLSHENDIAVVLLMSITESGHTAQEYMKNIADYYKLPVISYADALTYMFENQKMTWQDFSDDQSHPNVGGHKLVAEMIAYYYDTLSDQPSEQEPPLPQQPYYSSRQETAELIENDQLTPEQLGSFTVNSNTAGFTKGWTYSKSENNEPAVFKVTGKFVYMIFRENSSGNLGNLDVTVKCGDEILSELTVSGIQPNGWGDPGIATLYMDTQVNEYTVEVKMAEDSLDKEFQILAFAVTT